MGRPRCHTWARYFAPPQAPSMPAVHSELPHKASHCLSAPCRERSRAGRPGSGPSTLRDSRRLAGNGSFPEVHAKCRGAHLSWRRASTRRGQPGSQGRQRWALCAARGCALTAMQAPHARARGRASGHAAAAPPPRLRRWPLKLNLICANPPLQKHHVGALPIDSSTGHVCRTAAWSAGMFGCAPVPPTRATLRYIAIHVTLPRLPAPLQICAVHIKAPHVAIDGRDMRFCQK